MWCLRNAPGPDCVVCKGVGMLKWGSERFPILSREKRRKERKLGQLVAEQCSSIWEGNIFRLGPCCEVSIKLGSSALGFEVDVMIYLRCRKEHFMWEPWRFFPHENDPLKTKTTCWWKNIQNTERGVSFCFSSASLPLAVHSKLHKWEFWELINNARLNCNQYDVRKRVQTYNTWKTASLMSKTTQSFLEITKKHYKCLKRCRPGEQKNQPSTSLPSLCFLWVVMYHLWWKKQPVKAYSKKESEGGCTTVVRRCTLH